MSFTVKLSLLFILKQKFVDIFCEKNFVIIFMSEVYPTSKLYNNNIKLRGDYDEDERN
jgi:hypothetical protein